MTKKAAATKTIDEKRVWGDSAWTVWQGELKRNRGNPGSEHLFKLLGEKLPFASLPSVRKHVNDKLNQGRRKNAKRQKAKGVYIAHDSMGCPRYIGRGDVFGRLNTRWKAQQLELAYFSFYLVADKKHEGEIETLLIRAAGPLLEFNARKKQVGIKPGSIRDYEAGTQFYERQYKKGRKS